MLCLLEYNHNNLSMNQQSNLKKQTSLNVKLMYKLQRKKANRLFIARRMPYTTTKNFTNVLH